MPEIITLRGRREGESVEFNPSKHVKLTDGFYEKSDSDSVVNVNGRYFRRNSPLILELSPIYYGKDSFALAEECCKDALTGHTIFLCDSLETYFTDYAVSDTGDVYELKEPTRIHYKTQCVTMRVDGKNGRHIDVRLWGDYSRSERDGHIVRISSSLYVQSKHILPLHSSYGSRKVTFLGMSNNSGNGYIKSVQQAEEEGIVVVIDSGYHFSKDIDWSKDQEGNNYRPILNRNTGFRIDKRENPYSISKGLQPRIRQTVIAINASSPIPNSAVNELLRSSWFEETRLDADFSSESYSTHWGFYVGVKGDARILNDLYEKIASISSPDKAREKIKASNWFGPFNKEPIPTMYSRNSIGNQGGDYVYNLNKSNRIGKTFNLTGSIGYTFGVELETEFGVTPLEVARTLPVDCVGDRSVGSLEYVTGVLSGDEGMNTLMHVADTVSKYSMVADTCGVHVHVGGNGKDWQPVFDKEFSVLAIMLGVMIEDELFSLMPLNRRDKKNSNGQSYCASIKDYASIKLNNWKKLLFSYVYGRLPEDDSEGFGDIKSMVERRHQVGRWGVGRYKWLNLVNCLTDNSGRRNGGGFQTIEFRAFNGTLNKDDLRAFVLISLAFVAYIEMNRDSIPIEMNRDSIPKTSGIRIMDIISSTMDKPSTEFMSKWYQHKLTQVRMVAESVNTPKSEKANTI